MHHTSHPLGHHREIRRFLRDLALLALLVWAAWTLVPAACIAALLAYLLDPLVVGACRVFQLPRWVASWGVASLTAAAVVYLFIVSLPILITQAIDIRHQAPQLTHAVTSWLGPILERMHAGMTHDLQQAIQDHIQHQAVQASGQWVHATLAWVKHVMNVVTYVLLVPILLGTMLADKARCLAALQRYTHLTPQSLCGRWLASTHRHMGLYLRGKVTEAVVVTLASVAMNVAFGLPYGFLLGLLMGLSVLVPVVGAVVALAVLITVALWTWGWSHTFLWFSAASLLLQLLDANCLVPYLFSNALSLHPLTIFIALLAFGQLFGFWGIFFAIPLASMLQRALQLLHAAMNNQEVP